MLGPSTRPIIYADITIEIPRAIFVSSHISPAMDLVTTNKPNKQVILLCKDYNNNL